ncbi:hypothetical protein [Raoultella ornithinolytica]|uniref:hypothetical protein n=1 Tax=Raoultella ornithinolytica TaxID=54291 RepID=UPI0013F3BE2A|nr:hypothetical protein [Raoultella ornithinolytica]QIJ49919.1 hypothetical protein G7Z36_17740 [Raoultella ornithinolytica]
MQCRVPPGDTSQLTTGIGLLFPHNMNDRCCTALTEPRAHSRIHRIAKPVVLALRRLTERFLLTNHCAVIGFDGVTLVFSCLPVKIFIEKSHYWAGETLQYLEFVKDIFLHPA